MITIKKERFDQASVKRLRNGSFECNYDVHRPLTANAEGDPLYEVKPTLFELEQVDPFQMYDVFDVDCFRAEEKAGHDVGNVHAYVSLLNTSPYITIGGKILHKDNGEVLETLPPRTVSNARKIELGDALYIEKGVDPKKLVLSVEARYEVDGRKQNVIKNTDISLKAGELDYSHIHPKKKKNRDDLPVKLGTPQNNPPAKHNLPTDANHIVICLVRYPDDYGDIDYICGFGSSSVPYGGYLGIPGAGRFYGPVGSKFMAGQSSGYCVIKDVDGGGCMAANSNTGVFQNVPSKTITINTDAETTVYTSGPGDLTFEGDGNEGTFSMLGVWHNNGVKVVYTETGGFKKKYFHVNVYLTLCFQINGTNVYFNALITSEDVKDLKYDYIHTVLPLSVMYGCLMKGTPIAMAEGVKNIEDVRIGDRLAPTLFGGVPVVKNVWRGTESKRLIRIADEEGNVVSLTENHPVITNAGVKPAEFVTEGSIVYTKDAKPVKVKSNTSFSYMGEVYNLDVDAGDAADDMAHCFIAGGVVVGDNALQNREEE